MLFFVQTWAQTVLVQGQFLNSAHQPLDKVLIKHNESQTKAYSNEEGTFAIRLPKTESTLELSISRAGYQSIVLPLKIEQDFIDLGKWILKNEIQKEAEPLLIVDFDEITTTGLDDATTNGSGILQSRRTVFLEAVSFQFSTAFFSPRGTHRKHQSVYINGIKMEDLDRGTAPWSHWGGLNDITNASQMVDYGLASRGEHFGDLLGSVSFTVRPTNFRQGVKLSQAFSNRTYRTRSMVSFHTQLGQRWTLSGMGSFRHGNRGFRQGTPYTSVAGLLALEKRWEGKTSTWLTLWYTPVERGRSAPLTQEVVNLKGYHYNPYWGIDLGQARNARTHRAQFPYLFLNHAIHFSEKAELFLNAAYIHGEQGDSRLLYTGVRPLSNAFIGGGRNPDPVYYQNLPSYYLRDSTAPNIEGAYYAQKTLIENGQLDWANLRTANTSIEDEFARYAVYEDTKQVEKASGSLQFIYHPQANEFWNSSLHFKKSNAIYFAQPTDFLGAKQWYDIDPYAERFEAQQNNLNRSSAIVQTGEAFQYHYGIVTKSFTANTRWSKQWKSLHLFLGANFQARTYQRVGYFKNGAFPENSFGAGEEIPFKTITSTAGVTVRLSPRHQLLFHGGAFQRPPDIRSVYPNPRDNQLSIPEPLPEKSLALEVSYRWQAKRTDLTMRGYWINQKNINEVAFYFADGVGGDEAFFVQEVLRGKESLQQGVEVGLKHTFADLLDIKFAASFGKHQ